MIRLPSRACGGAAATTRGMRHGPSSPVRDEVVVDAAPDRAYRLAEGGTLVSLTWTDERGWPDALAGIFGPIVTGGAHLRGLPAPQCRHLPGRPHAGGRARSGGLTWLSTSSTAATATSKTCSGDSRNVRRPP